MSQNLPETPTIRLAELMAALSLATDLGMGQPLEFALCACVLSVRLGQALGVGETELRDVYYQALLRYIGCNAETHMLAAIFGDELVTRTNYAVVDAGRQPEMAGFITQNSKLKTRIGCSPYAAPFRIA